MTVFLGTGQQLVERDEDHDARDEGQQQGVDEGCPEGEQEEEADEGPYRLGQTRGERVPEGFLAAARGLVDGYRHGYAFGYVVYGDGHDYGDGDVEVAQCRGEGSKPLGEVVDTDGQRHEHSGALQPAGVGELLDTVYLVRVLVFGDEEVDEGDKRGAGKEGGQHVDVGHARAQLLPQHAQRLGHQLHERDVDHDPGRESQGGR